MEFDTGNGINSSFSPLMADTNVLQPAADADLICAICLSLAFESVVTSCNHHYCCECWDKLTATALSENRTQVTCPTCRTEAVSVERDHEFDERVQRQDPAHWHRRMAAKIADAKWRARAAAPDSAEAAKAEAALEAAEEDLMTLPDGRITRVLTAGLLKRHAKEQCSYRTYTLASKLELSLCGLRQLNESLHAYSLLTTLRLEHNYLTSLDPIQLPQLKVLVVHHNRLETLGDALRGVPELLQLDCGSNFLQSLSGVEHLTKLSALVAPHNRLADGAALEPLCTISAGVSSVEIHGNLLSTMEDISPLIKLSELRTLRLSENAVAKSHSRTQILETLPQVRMLDGSPNAEALRIQRERQREERQRSISRSNAAMMERKRLAEERRAAAAAAAATSRGAVDSTCSAGEMHATTDAPSSAAVTEPTDEVATCNAPVSIAEPPRAATVPPPPQPTPNLNQQWRALLSEGLVPGRRPDGGTTSNAAEASHDADKQDADAAPLAAVPSTADDPEDTETEAMPSPMVGIYSDTLMPPDVGKRDVLTDWRLGVWTQQADLMLVEAVRVHRFRFDEAASSIRSTLRDAARGGGTHRDEPLDWHPNVRLVTADQVRLRWAQIDRELCREGQCAMNK